MINRSMFGHLPLTQVTIGLLSNIRIQRTTNDERLVSITANPTINYNIVTHVLAHILNCMRVQGTAHYCPMDLDTLLSLYKQGKILLIWAIFLALYLRQFYRKIVVYCYYAGLYPDIVTFRTKKPIYSETRFGGCSTKFQQTSLNISVNIFYYFHFCLSVLFSDYDCSVIFICDV